MRSFRQAREGVKQYLEGSDADLDRIIRSVRENKGVISNKLEKEFSLLSDALLAVKVKDVIQGVFEAGNPGS